MRPLTILLRATPFLLLSSLLMSPSSGVTQSVLATICSQTQNQEGCANILQSDSRTSSADLPQLSLISLDLIMKQASGNFGIFDQYKRNTSEPVLKGEYSKCVGLYLEMKGVINKATELSQKKEYKKISEQLGQLTTMTYSCANGLPLDSPTNGINEDMLLTSQTAVSVNSFVSESP